MNYHNNNDLILKLVLSKINYTFYEKKSLKKKENIICQKWMNEIRGKNYLILKLIKKLTKNDNNNNNNKDLILNSKNSIKNKKDDLSKRYKQK